MNSIELRRGFKPKPEVKELPESNKPSKPSVWGFVGATVAVAGAFLAVPLITGAACIINSRVK